MTTRVRLKGFRSKFEPLNEADERSRNDKPDEESNVFEGRFKATRLWNGMLKRFRNGMPVKRHRRALRTYEECFIGREAVDFLMNELPKFLSEDKEITRSNCILLLNKYLGLGLFSNARGKFDLDDSFKENEIYRFSNISVEKLASTPILIRRAASFNERYGSSNESSNKKDFGLTAPQRLHSRNWQFANEVMMPARTAIPTMQQSGPLSRRLSASHGNLSSLIQASKSDADAAGFSRNGIRQNVTKNKESSMVKQVTFEQVETANYHTESGNSKQVNALDDVISELAKINEHKHIMTNDEQEKPDEENIHHRSDAIDSLRKFGTVIQVEGSEEEHIFAVDSLTNNATKMKVIDESSVYKSVLSKRLLELLSIASTDEIIKFEFCGDDVKWNCEKVGTKGIVRVHAENDDDANICKETVFSNGDTPLTRYVLKKSDSRVHKVHKNLDSVDTNRSINKHSSAGSEMRSPHMVNVTQTSMSTLSGDGDSNSSGTATYETVLMRLPGLKRSPELIQRLEELAKRNARAAYLCRSSTPLKADPTLDTGMTSKESAIAKEAIALLMLTLIPRVRRRLHYLLRFMQRVCRNHCLILDSRHSNRSIVLEKLSSKILVPSELITPEECSQLIAFLMDNESDTFGIPLQFKSEVEREIARQKEVLVACSSTAAEDASTPRSTEEMKEYFCEPIDITEYDCQKSNDLEGHLLSLLDGIVADENISLVTRKKQLKKV